MCRRESADFVSRLQSDSIWVVVLEKLRQGLGCVRGRMPQPQWRMHMMSAAAWAPARPAGCRQVHFWQACSWLV